MRTSVGAAAIPSEWLWGWDPTPGIVSVWAEPSGLRRRVAAASGFGCARARGSALPAVAGARPARRPVAPRHGPRARGRPARDGDLARARRARPAALPRERRRRADARARRCCTARRSGLGRAPRPRARPRQGGGAVAAARGAVPGRDGADVLPRPRLRSAPPAAVRPRDDRLEPRAEPDLHGRGAASLGRRGGARGRGRGRRGGGRPDPAVGGDGDRSRIPT